MTKAIGRRIIPALFLAILALVPSCKKDSPSESPGAQYKLPQGAVAWIPANGSATEILTNRPIAMLGNVTFDSGFVGQAFRFDGVSAASLADSSNLDLRSSLSVVCWAKLDTPLALQPAVNAYSYYPFLVSKGNGGYATRSFGLYFNQLAGSLAFNGVTADSNFVFLAAVPDAGQYFDDLKWHLVAAIWDRASQTATIYIDGQAMTSAGGLDQDLVVTNLPVMIGAGFYDKYFLKGRIDEVLIFSRALSSTEVSTIFQSGSIGLSL